MSAPPRSALRRPALVLALVTVLAPLILTVVTDDLLARPGGGHSFSGSSRGGGGHGGGGDGGGAMLIFQLLALLFHYPLLGLIVLGLIIFFIVMAGKQKAAAGWSTATPPPPPVPPVPGETPRARIEKIRTLDPAFSLVGFEDFLYGLYTEFHRARGAGALQTLSAYFLPHLLALPAPGDLEGIENVVVGSMNYTRVLGVDDPAAPNVVVGVRFESNYTEVSKTGRRQGVYAMEDWTLSRARNAVSRPPDKAKSLGCPGCGAPVSAVVSGTCSFCKRQVANGAFDWFVQGISLVRMEYKAPTLTSYMPERGTGLPTVRDPGLDTGLADLVAKDPSFALDAFLKRVGLVFGQFQQSWSACDLRGMRPFLSDTLFQTQMYWIEAYKSQGLRNVTENARITAMEPVKVSSDAWFDTLTVRIFATGLDYTVDTAGKVVAGSRTREKPYSEYWTFIRGAGKQGKPRADLACPRCGAPLAINMSGECEYCTARVTSGEYDWVLSRIEQDEVYRG